jgi:tetratricopeptide (TPR) repeat protein
MKSLDERLMLILGVIALAASLNGCATTKSPKVSTTSAVLRGMVYNENRMPVQDVSVSWGDATEKIALTDIHGRYYLPGVPFGTVTLHFKKGGFESLDWTFSFNGPTQVVYVQMANLDELLDNAADAIQQRNWTEANSYLSRIKKLDADNRVAVFLHAELLSRQGNPEQAAALLEGLSSSQETSFAVELALADLYQNTLGQPDKALLHLKKALTVQNDVDVESRIAALEKK